MKGDVDGGCWVEGREEIGNDGHLCEALEGNEAGAGAPFEVREVAVDGAREVAWDGRASVSCGLELNIICDFDGTRPGIMLQKRDTYPFRPQTSS